MKESTNAVADLSSNKSESINGALTDHRPVSSLSLRSISSELFQIWHDNIYLIWQYIDNKLYVY